MYEELKSEAAERRIELRLGSLPPIHGDRTLIRQVFTNLLSNAIKFTGTRDTAIIEAGCRAEGKVDEGATFYFALPRQPVPVELSHT